MNLLLRAAGALPALLLAVAPALQAQESVTLTFGWTPGVAAVTTITESSALMGGQPMGFENEVQYQLTVAEAADGLRVSVDGFVVDGTELEELFESVDSERMSELMAYTRPDWLVSATGQYRGMANYEEVRAVMEGFLEEMLAELEGEAQGMGDVMRDMMESSVSEEVMDESAELEWDRLVGWWAGRTLTEGEPTTVVTEMQAAMIGNKTFQVETALVFAGRVSCDEEGTGEDCLELVSRGSPDAEELRDAMDIFMADMMEQAGGTGMEMGITSLMLDQEARLVVEPGTLRPVRTEMLVDLTMEMEMMGMSQRMENRQVQRTYYTWGN